MAVIWLLTVLIWIFAHIGEPLVEQLMLDLNIDEVKASEAFYASKTFTQLAAISTELYKKDWQEIYEMLQKELTHSYLLRQIHRANASK